MATFTDIVSLGFRCRTTRRFRDHFGVEASYPFDWWVTTAKGVLRFVRHWDVDRLFDIEQLQEVGEDGRIGYVEHPYYGVKFQHDFPSVDNRITPDWRDHIATAKSRTAYLMQKLERLNERGRRILFYREFSPSDKSPELIYPAIPTAVKALVPQAKCAFLLVSPDGRAMPGWRSLAIDDPEERPWTGDPAIWDPALASLGWTVERPPGGAPEREGPAAEEPAAA